MEISNLFFKRDSRFLIVFFLVFNFVNGQDLTSEEGNRFVEYVKNESEAVKVDSSVFYYVSTESDKDFIENMASSFITFVKGSTSISIDEIEGNAKEGGVVSLNSTCSVKEITLKKIISNLNTNKTYKGLIAKNILSQNILKFDKDKIVAIVLYSDKLKNFVSPYIKVLKRLKDESQIDFYFLTMDSNSLEGLPDVYQDSVFSDKKN